MDRSLCRIKQRIYKNSPLLILALPGIILVFLFNYLPMFGVVIAFKKYNFTSGILGSPWVGLQNFRFLFTNAKTFVRIVRNTVGYYALFTAVGTVCNIALAISLYECTSKRFAKISQTIMIMPTFISYIAVTFIVKALLDTKTGLINHMLLALGQDKILWYMTPKYWPFILTIVNIWKGTGYGSILYLSALSGMDQEIFEAAQLDGANKWQQIRYVTLPMLRSMVVILLLLGLGGIMTSNTGLFYQVTKNQGILYSTTQTIDAYVLNSVMDGSSEYGVTAAVTFFQSIVGCVMVISVNLLVRRFSPENSLF